MKMTGRQLAMKMEQILGQNIPKHVFTVSHSNAGIKVNIIFAAKAHEYIASKSMTGVQMTADQIVRNYMAARYPKPEGAE